MKKRVIVPLAACAVAAVLAAAALAFGTRQAADAPAEPPAAVEHTADRLSEDAPPEPEPKEEPSAEPPALTLEEVRRASFSDVPAGDAQADYISYAVSCGFLQGKEPGRFAPEDFASRGELMHTLLRMSGQEAPAYSGGFSDVSAEDRALLQQALSGLSGEERQIILLHAVSGLKHREIAQLLERPLSTVLSKYHRGLKKMKALMKGESDR